jgi:Zn ribbon nucleic-acid-binding protein
LSWEKQNLVTLKDMSDIYKCSKCGYEQKYFGIGGRSQYCPKCKPEDIYGGWSSPDSIGKSKCYHCGRLMIKVTKDHPNGKYLHLKRHDDEILTACPKNCGEKTGIKPGVTKRHILK